MLRSIAVVPLCAVGLALVLESSLQAQTAGSELPVSVDRIRAALKQQPPVLQVPHPPGDAPMFHVEVRERPFVLEPIEEKPFDPTYGLPSLGELVMSGIEKIRSAAHGRAERRARREVDDALAAFCGVNDCPASPRTATVPWRDRP